LSVIALTADGTAYTADTTVLTADMTQIVIADDITTGIANWPPMPRRQWRKGRENDEAILLHLLH
jgi:hypothetical protein